MSGEATTKYRADIDGLRALAVAPVVLYHVGFGTPGGFAGVDVFFVISGYLITAILLNELTQGDFSIARFYERRARRLFPALFAMLTVTTFVASIWLVPGDLLTYAKSAVATLFFISNIFFYTEVGYFNESANLSPLLHTWSLGVEEQFYLVAPLVLAILWRFLPKWAVKFVLVIGVLVSFIAGVWLAGHPAGFYLPFFRAWELGIGVLLALWSIRVNSKFAADSLGVLGFVLLIGTFTFASSSTPWPGLAALAPCVGAGAIIVSGTHKGSLITKFLGGSVLVGLGKISYSLYLWHWPVIVFASYGRFESFAIWEKLFLVMVSLGLAVLSWFWIEQPIRRRRFLGSRTAIATSSVLGGGVIFTVASILVFSDGLPSRVPSAVASQWKRPAIENVERPCHFVTAARAATGDLCIRGAEGVSPSFVLVGDSHADALSPGIFEASENLGISGYQFTGPGFTPTPGRHRLGSVTNKRIYDSRVEALIKFLEDRPGIRFVLITGWWHHYATGQSYRGQNAFWADGECPFAGSRDCTSSSLERSLIRLAQRLEDRMFIILDDVPVGWELHPESHFRAAFRGLNAQPPVIPLEAAKAQFDAYAPVLKKVSFVSPNMAFHPVIFGGLCNDSGCSAVGHDGELIFSDGDHLSVYGALMLSGGLGAALEPIRSAWRAQESY